MRGADNELAVSSRSMLQIMQAFSSHIDAPEAHLKEHSAWPVPERSLHHIRIHSGKQKPTARTRRSLPRLLVLGRQTATPANPRAALTRVDQCSSSPSPTNRGPAAKTSAHI
jgi:hypothetical protein